MTDITIIIPVYNEAENIRVAVETIEAQVAVSHRISIVYDFEEDTTVPVARELAKTIPNLALIRNKYGRGVLNAIKTGLEEAEGSYAIVTMADLSDPPKVINDMVAVAEREDADIVCASRYMKGGKQIGGPFLKGLLSRMAGLTLYWFAGLPTHDPTNSFKLYRISFLRSQTIESQGGFELGIELVVKAYINGHRICETPTIWTDRVAGQSNFKLFSWLPGYLKWYFYAFRPPKPPEKREAKNSDGLSALIMKNRARFVKYFFVGLFCALINWGLFYVLNYRAHIHYLSAGFLAFIVSTTVNYFLSAKIFVSRGRGKAAEYVLVAIASAFALAIDLGVMYLLVDKAQIAPMIAKILGTGTAFLFNYMSRQFFIFKAW